MAYELITVMTENEINYYNTRLRINAFIDSLPNTVEISYNNYTEVAELGAAYGLTDDELMIIELEYDY